MSYVSVNAPLPPNSLDPIPAGLAACNQRVVQRVEQQVAAAKAASAQIAAPGSFSSLGQGVVNDVTRGQGELIAAQSMMSKPRSVGSKQSARAALLNAPVQVPMNVPVEQFAGCAIRGETALLPVKVQRVSVADNMPPAAPTDTQLLTAPGPTPVSEVAPAVVPPRMVPGSGTFSIATGPARPMQYYSIVNRGMGSVAWGDASGSPLQRPAAGMSGKGLLLLALGGLGLYAMTKKGRR